MATSQDTSEPQGSAIGTIAPWILNGVITAAAVFILRAMSRVWWCECGETNLWSGDVWSQHNSQHFVDHYSITHVSHGLIFGVLFACLPVIRYWRFGWQLAPSVAVEALWEIIENTPMVINRYRETTMALGYTGDSITNSIGDIVCFILGFAFAMRVKWYWSAMIFAATEFYLLVAIRDNLSLNVLMLLFPIDAVKDWQMAGAGG